MRSKNRLRMVTSLFIFCLSCFTVQAQESLQYKSANKVWESALEKFENKNFGVARQEFSEFIEMQEGRFSDRKTQAEFYKAWCAIELFRPDAEKEMKAFIRKYPESNKIQSAYFQLGRQQYRNKKYKAALVWLEQVDVYRLAPEHVKEYQFKMGYAYFMQEEYEKARSYFFELIDEPGDYNAPANYYYAHIAYTNGNYQTALNAFEKLSKNKSFAPVVPYYITQIYYLQKKYDKLLEYAPQFLDDASVKRSAEIAQMIGLSHYQSKEYKKAIPYLEKGKESLTRKGRFAYGYCLYKQKQYAEAIEQFEKVGGEEDEMLQVANYCLADCYLKTGDKNGAKAAFAATARMDFDANMQQDALFNFAKLSYELSYSPFNETIKAFDEYLQKYPDSDRNDEAYDYLVKVYMTTKNYRDALASMDKINNKTPQIKKAYQRVAWLRGLELMKQLNYREAIAMFDASLQHKIYHSKIAAECLYWKAEALYRMGDTNAAISLYNSFLLSPGAGTSNYFGRAYYNIAYAYFDQENYEEASDWFRKFVNQSDKKDQYTLDAYNRIGDCFFVEREYSKAAEFYKKSADAGNWDADYAVFQQAFSLGLLNRVSEKARLLEEFRTTHPNSEYTDDALFELAQARVKLEDQRSAISLYKNLANNYPQSSYAAKSLLQLGLMNYNQKDYQEAIRYYKQVVREYPQSEEKKSAFVGLKNVYVDLNRVNDYFAFAESSGEGGGIRNSEKDSLSYISAERLYMSGETERGTKALEQYLAAFPNGMFRLNARYYQADAALNQEKYEEALAGFEAVVKEPANLFTERALLAASQLNYRNKNFAKAKLQYERLKQIAEIPENTRVAKVGYMRSAYRLEEYENCIDGTREVLDMSKLEEELEREAKYYRAKSYLMRNETSQALADLTDLAKETQTAEGAEAKYRLARIYFDKGQVARAEQEINQFVEMNSPHHYWLAESFLLLSDVFLQKKDEFQARYTLQSIVDNYGIKDDGILERAQKKLDALLALEKQKEQEIKTKDVQVQFEGTSKDEAQKLFESKAQKSESLGLDEERELLKEILEKEDKNTK